MSWWPETFWLLCCKHSLRPSLQNCVCNYKVTNYKVFGVWYGGVSGLCTDMCAETCRAARSGSPHLRVLSAGQQACYRGEACGSEAGTLQTFHSVVASPPPGLAGSAAVLLHSQPAPPLAASRALLGRPGTLPTVHSSRQCSPDSQSVLQKDSRLQVNLPQQ